MDVLKFLQQGNVSKNPEYNPKTKEGKTKSPLLVDYNVGENISDKLRKNITSNLSKNIYNLNTDDINKYAEYDVYLNTYNSQEQLNKEGAENQSAVEQLGRAVTQAIGNEVVLGTLLGVSNLVDFFANIGTPDGKDDYTNPVSTQLENWQDQIRTRFEIYQKDPNASWAIGDFGWWANNAVSIASTASMLIPSTGIVKGASLLGKIGKIGSVASKGALLAGKAAKHLKIGTSAIRNAQAIKSGAEIGLTALASRTMEGYLEARGVYNETKQETVDKLNSMSDSEFSEFITRNPQFENKSTEEIANYIASISADETFANDYAMLLMDIAQFKALGSLWKGVAKKIPSAALRVENKKAIKSLLDDVVEEGVDVAKKQGFGTARLDIIKETLANPFTTIGGIEWSEGLEEAYQGIQTEKGKEVAKMILDPNYSPRTIESYIADPDIWEQAFWGVLGGVGFQAVGTGLGNIYRRVDAKINKDKYSDKDIDVLLTSEEKIRKEEITRRKARLTKFTEDIELVNNGLSPDEYERNENTGRIVVENGIAKRKELTKAEQEIKKDKLLNDLLTEMATDAIDVGNYDLFLDYLSSEEFDKFLKNAGVDSSIEGKQFNQYMIDKMNNIADTYSTELYNILSNTEVEHESVAKILAREITREKLAITEYDSKINDLYNQINKINTGSSDSIDKYKRKYIADKSDKILNDLSDLENQYYTLYRHKIISQQAFEQYKNDINNSRKVIESYQKSNETIINDSSIPDALDSTKDLIDQIVEAEIQKEILNGILPNNNKDYEKRAQEIQEAVDRKIKVKYDEAAKKVEDWIKKQEDINSAKEAIYTSNVPELQKELDILKIGHESTRMFTTSIDAVFAQERKNREEEQTPKINGNPTSQATSAPIETQINVVEQNSTNVSNNQNTAEQINQTVPSTGEESKTPIAVTEVDVMNDADAGALAYTIISELFKDNYNLFENPTEQSTNQLIDEIVNQLYEKGYDSNNIRNIASKTLNDWLKLASKFLKRKNSDKIGDVETLLSIINYKAQVTIDNDSKNAITKLLSDTELDSVIDDLLKKYIELNNLAITNGNKTVISLENFFRYIIDNCDVDVDTAMHILLNMKNFITSNNHNYIFKEKRKLNNILKNPDLFFNKILNTRIKEEVVDEYMHINATNEKVRDPRYNSVINSLAPGDELTVTDGTFGKHHSPTTLNITRNGIPIGYITKVNVTPDNNGYSLQISENSTDLRYLIRKNSDGTFTSNTDDLFNEFFENEQLFNLLNKYYIYSLEGNTAIEPTEEETNLILNNPIIKQAINDRVIVFNKQADTNARKAKVLIDKLKNIVFYDNTSESIEDFKDSYKQWIVKQYNNFKNTHKIQTAVENSTSKKINITYAGMGGNVNTSQDTGLIRQNTERGINSLNLFYDKHPIVVVSRQNNRQVLLSEKPGVETVSSVNLPYGTGTMGMKVGGSNENPHIVLFTSPNAVLGDINVDLTKELLSLFKSYQSSQITFEELKNSLSELYNGHSSSTNFNKNALFRGIELYEKDGKLHLLKHYKNEDGEDKRKLILSIHKYKPNAKDIGTGIYYATDLISSDKFDDKTLSKIVKEVVDNTTYNATFYAIDNKHEDNPEKTNKYFYKENGKLVVEINGNKRVYENFGHFVLENNAFNTTQGVNAEGGFYNNADKIKSLYIDLTEIIKPETEISPVEGSVSSKDFITSASSSKLKSSKDLLNLMGFNSDYIDFLLGNNNYGIPLIASKFGYYKSKNVQGYYKNGKIYFGNQIISLENNNPQNILRVLLHESLHQKFADKALLNKEHVVNGLIDTFEETVNAVNKILEKGDKTSPNYKVIEEINNLLTKLKNEYGDNKQVLAEEWLAESLSQKALIQFLNNTTYTKGRAVVDNIKSEDKTIWQKIIDLLLKLFGINSGNIKNNTIFAQQYLVLSEQFKETISEDSTKDNVDIVEQDSIDEAVVETEEENIDDILDDILGEDSSDDRSQQYINRDAYAITSNIEEAKEDYIEDVVNNDGNATAETFGVTRVSNMNDYINTFPIQDQPLIAKMVENGELEWVCR